MIAGHGHERAVLADESHHLSQMWGQLTGSDGPPFDVEEHCAEVTAGEGLFPACDRMQSCIQQYGVDDACTKVVIVSTQKPDKQKGRRYFCCNFGHFCYGKSFLMQMQECSQIGLSSSSQAWVTKT